jgi:CBS domain containing-hemolysin-like protein
MGICFALLSISGLMSGLTIGLASIDHLTLEIAAKQSKKMEVSAKNIFAVINQHHWMLVTLLFCNACCLEALPIYLSKAVSEFYAILFSIFGVLVVGEIIPQAICTGPQQI